MDNFVFKDCSWDKKLNENWNQEFGESLHFDYILKYPNSIVNLPKGSNHIQPFRICELVKTEKDAKIAVSYFEQRIDEYNKNIDKKYHKFEYHILYCEEKNTIPSAWWVALTPQCGGKGAALKWLCNHLNVRDDMRNRVIVCGDSGNDISMMNDERYRNVIMGNSSQALLSFYNENKETRNGKILLTRQHRTLGVIEGLNHFAKVILK